MPIDPSIPLQQVQQPGLLQTFGQIYALKNAQQENQLRSLQVQGAQMDMQDRSALAQAYRDNFKPDAQGNRQFDRQGFESDVLQNAPRMYPQVIQQGIEMQKQQLGLQGQQLQAAQAHTNFVAQHLQGITDAPPDQKQTIYTASRNQMIQQGVLQPGSPQDPGAVYPGDDAVGRLMASTMNAKDTIAAKQKDLQNQIALLTQQQTAHHNAATEQQAQNTLQQAAKRDAQTAAYQRGELGMRGAQVGLDRQRLGLDQQRLGLEYGMTGGGSNLTGDAFLQSLPAGMQGQVKAIANGDLPMPAARSGPGLMLSRAVTQYDPSYTQARFTGKQSFKTGDDAKTLQNLATTLGHVDNLKATSDKLGLAPLLGTKFQGSEDAGMSAALQGASGEIGKLITGGVVPEGEFNALKESMSSSRPAVRAAAIDKFRELIADRVAGIQQKYKAATGQELPAGEFFDAPTQKRLQTLQGGADSGGSVGVMAPNGRTYHFKDQASADAFKQKAGIK